MFNEEEPIVSVPEVEAEEVPQSQILTGYLVNSLSSIRQQKGISQQQLADITGISQSTIARIETGESVPSVNTLNALLGPLGKTLVIAPLPGTEESITSRYLSLIFRDALDRKSTINVQNPRLNVTRGEAEEVMHKIIDGSVFLSRTGEKLTRIEDVRMTTVESL